MSILITACASGQTTTTTSSAASGQSPKGPAFTLAWFSPWGTSWSYNYFSPSFLTSLENTGLMPLAIGGTSFGKYLPQLASSWQVSPTSVTLHLRADAKWQTGQPVTSKDVETSLLLNGANGNGLWANIASVSTPDQHTVVIKLRPGSSPQLFLNSLLAIFPVPASEFGKFVIPNLERDLIQYYPPSTSTSTSSSAPKAISTAISGVVTKLQKFSPSTFIGDGPFRLQKVNTQALLMKRSPSFWAAAKVHVSGLEVESFTDESAFYPALYGGHIDLAQASMPGPATERWQQEAGAGYTTMNNFAESALYFNDSRYPFTIPGVRQAIAYIINRKKITYLDSGDHPQGPWVRVPDGLFNSTTNQYLSKSEVKSLNTYSYDPAKATRLLEHLGFHKRGSAWYTPQGNRFTVTIGSPAGWTNSMEDADAAAQMMTNFGINTSATAVEQPGYWTFQQEGNFDMDWGWGAQGVLDPLAQATAVVGQSHNYLSSTDKGISYGPEVKVPGLGTVDAATTASHETKTVGSGSAMQKLTWDWAKLDNQEMPYLPLWDKYQQVEYSKTSFTHWPAASSSIWALMGANWEGAIAVALEEGYIRPAK